jgi:hypothetical protein
VAWLWVATIVLQRLTVPGLPVPLLLPVVAGWAVWGVYRGVATVDRTRLTWWLVASAGGALVMPLQTSLVPQPLISPSSWALFMAVWAPFVLRASDRSPTAYRATLRLVALAGTALAALCIAMMATQLLGIPYRDWIADVVPEALRFTSEDFVITYPLAYESPIYRANGWIGLEPSFVSAQIGLGLLAAVLAGMRRRVAAVLLVGMLCTAAGSGFLLAAVGLLVVALSRGRRMLRPYVPLGVAAVAAAVVTPIGRSLLSRATEAGAGRSSTSLRTVLPYQELWPSYVREPLGVLLGRGPGSSQDLVLATDIPGLIVPTPMKIFFEYGVVAGALVAGFLLLCMLRGPSRSIAFTLFFSLWTVQPGTTTVLIVAPVLLLVTVWSPRPGTPLESPPREPASRASPRLRTAVPSTAT